MRSMCAPVSSSRNSTAIERRRTVSAWAISSSESARRRSSLRSSTSSWSALRRSSPSSQPATPRQRRAAAHRARSELGRRRTKATIASKYGERNSGRPLPRRAPCSHDVPPGTVRDRPVGAACALGGAAEQRPQLVWRGVVPRRVLRWADRSRWPCAERRPTWGGPLQANLCDSTHEKHSVLTLLVYSVEIAVRLSYPETSYANQLESLGSSVPAHRASATYFVSRYSPMPSKPPSRPKPDCLTPPKGAAGLETMPWLTPTMPASIASLTRNVRARSRV